MKPCAGISGYLLSLGLIALLDAPAFAATVTIGASKDNTLFQDATGDESNGSGEALFAGLTGDPDGDRIRRGTIAFNIASAVPANAVITGVSLTLFLVKAGSFASGETVSLHALTADWGEGASVGFQGHPGSSAVGDATWFHRFYNTAFWGTPGGDFASQTSASTQVQNAFQSYSWTGPALIQDVQKWLNAPSSNFGWIMIGDEVDPFTAVLFGSREASDSTERPQLTITFTVIPEPATAALLIGGAMLLAAPKRPRRAPR